MTIPTRHIGYSIIDTVYGINNDHKDHILAMENEIMGYFAEADSPGRYLVDAVPARGYPSHALGYSKVNILSVRYVPSWMPGAGFQKIAERTCLLSDEMRRVPMQIMSQAMVRCP